MLRAVNVIKAFGAHRAPNNVSLRVEPGDIYCLLGAKGKGKTTLII